MPSRLQRRPFIKVLNIDRAPVDVFQHIYGASDYAFMYESMENEKQRGRFSFVGGRPGMVFKARKRHCTIITSGHYHRSFGDPFRILEELVKKGRSAPCGSVFSGGAVGYVSYDAVRYIERIPDTRMDTPRVPELYFMFPTEILIFDHKNQTVRVVCYGNRGRLNVLASMVRKAPPVSDHPAGDGYNGKMVSNTSRRRFHAIVNKAKHYIQKGDIFQVVLSQRFVRPVTAHPFTIYRNLRRTNPSPYMYFLNMKGLTVLGSSPETLIKLHNGTITSYPIAGTRPRGISKRQDTRLAQELIHDEKEKAEHVMLVDLARNDVGQVSRYGSVKVSDLMRIERFSKVMHITSRVSGDLKPGVTAFDVFRASFPAGTVSGAPKVRAMEIIDELETTRRGIYAGAIGYFGFNNDMDFCIAIRTIVIHRRHAFIQSGAGIVADSVPESEYQETLHKMAALQNALEFSV